MYGYECSFEKSFEFFDEQLLKRLLKRMLKQSLKQCCFFFFFLFLNILLFWRDEKLSPLRKVNYLETIIIRNLLILDTLNPSQSPVKDS